jgi:hypothetical protein
VSREPAASLHDAQREQLFPKFPQPNNPGFLGDSTLLEDGVTVAQVKRYSPEVRDRAIRMVVDHLRGVPRFSGQRFNR